MPSSGLDIGRRKKAKRLAEIIRKLEGTVEDARRLTDQQWREVASLAIPSQGLKLPSEVTRAMVLEELAADPGPRDEDVPPEKETR